MPKQKIMVVEDESIVSRDIGNMLSGLGYNVAAIVSGAMEAIDIAKKKKPHLVLMDIMLEGKTTGVDAADYIYKHLNIPVVYLTAYADETTLQKAKKTAPFGYLLKPFEERELQTTIEIALYKFKMELELKERERQLFTILKNIADAVIATDKEGAVTFMNPLAETLTGWNQAEALQKPLGDIFKVTSEKTGQPFKMPFQHILSGRKAKLPHDALLISRSGNETHIEQKAIAILSDRHQVSGIVLSFTDITWRKKAEDEVKKSWEKLRSAMEGTVQAIANTIETRDPYTAGHQRRVTRLACAIAEEMKLPADRIEGLRMAGGLHDIGKISVPSEILNKPGQISTTEFDLIKIHPQAGYDILKPIDFPWPVAEIVYQHHERLDGSGYPQGLSRRKILLEASILAVADVVEAMASHRPYRPALSFERAIEEIVKHKGKLYEPKAVEACLKVFENGYDFG